MSAVENAWVETCPACKNKATAKATVELVTIYPLDKKVQVRTRLECGSCGFILTESYHTTDLNRVRVFDVHDATRELVAMLASEGIS